MCRNLLSIAAVLLAATFCFAQEHPSKVDTLNVVFKDGHHKAFAFADVSRLEFKNGAIVLVRDGHPESINISEISHIEFSGDTPFSPGRNHFVGRWKVRTMSGGSTFYITLEADGEARKTEGSSHGTWVVVNGEARISWDDGWHDIIRRVGEKHEKVAFEPGRSFDDNPSNVTEAINTTAQPI